MIFVIDLSDGDVFSELFDWLNNAIYIRPATIIVAKNPYGLLW
jgi:hypothetical protein